MKNLKKLTVALLALCTMAFCFGGCGIEKTSSQLETEAVERIREANIDSIADYTEREFAAILSQVSYDDFVAYKAQGSTLISRTFDNDFNDRWKTFTEAHGECVEAAVDETMREKYEYTSRIIMTGEDGAQMAMTITYDQSGAPIKTTIADYSDDSQQTMAQRLGVAGGNTIIGLLTVFTILVLLSLIIYCFKFVNRMTIPPTRKEEAPVPVAVPAAQKAAAAIPENDEMDPALVAVIAAAIAAAEEKPVEGFIVRSIRRAKSNKWR
ncbi:MAG: OadG family protein [Lachnospiraceae bacterium]|nr:OadG family protein [Lachnospiraceae bacterium]